MKSVVLTAVALILVVSVGVAQNPVNVNHAAASLTLNGGTTLSGCAGGTVTLAFSSDSLGNSFDIAIDAAPAATPIPLVDDTIELDLTTATSLFGGIAVGTTMPVVGHGLAGSGSATHSATFVGGAGQAVLQAGAIDFTDPDGASLSEMCVYDVVSQSLSLSLGDDDYADLTGDPCWVDVTFYGVVYNGAFVSSNGGVSFTSGFSDFSATYGEWTTQMPRVGIHSDLEPNNFGTVDVNFLADGVEVVYTDVAEWGTAGANTISYAVEVSASAGAAIGGIIQVSGAWGTSTVAGITDGAAGTHPAAVVFDTLGGAGAALATDSWIEENPAGMSAGAGSTVNNISFPTADGASVVVN